MTEAQSLTKRDGDKTAVDDLNFSVRRSRLAGPKARTMLRTALGVAAATLGAGGVLIGGETVSLDDSAQAAMPSGFDQSRWRARAPMTVPRAETGVAALGGQVYVVGGGSQVGTQPPAASTTMVTSYNPRTDRWRQRAPLPRPLSHPGVTTLNGKLYAIAGFTENVHIDPQNAAYAYSPKSNRWQRLPNLPEKLGSVSVAAVNGKLHVIGGRTSRPVVPLPGTPLKQGFGTVQAHFVFNSARRTWSRAVPMPSPARDHMGIAVLGDDIHVFGGRTKDVTDNLARHDVYNTKSRRWRSAAPLPTPRSSGAAVVIGGRILFAGGECKANPRVDPTATFNDVTAYNPRTNTWTVLAPLPQGRHAFGAAAVGDRAFFVSGALTCGGGASGDNLELRVKK